LAASPPSATYRKRPRAHIHRTRARPRGREVANVNAVLNDHVVQISTEQFTFIRIDVAFTQTILKIAQTNHCLFDANHDLGIVVVARPQCGDVESYLFSNSSTASRNVSGKSRSQRASARLIDPSLPLPAHWSEGASCFDPCSPSDVGQLEDARTMSRAIKQFVDNTTRARSDTKMCDFVGCRPGRVERSTQRGIEFNQTQC
jgi:hypothetical protein